MFHTWLIEIYVIIHLFFLLVTNPVNNAAESSGQESIQVQCDEIVKQIQKYEHIFLIKNNAYIFVVFNVYIILISDYNWIWILWFQVRIVYVTTNNLTITLLITKENYWLK